MQLAFTFGNQAISSPKGIPNGGLSYLQTVLGHMLTIFMIVGVFLLVIYIVWAGLQWISSGGDKQKVAAARGRITGAIIGLIIIFLAIFFINVVGYLFKVNLLNLV